MKLDFEKFFTGKTIANGCMIFLYPKKRKKTVKVEFFGSLKNNILTIEENYFENNIKISTRNWYFQKLSDGKYIGNEKSIIHPFKFIIKSSSLEMNYKFRTQFKNFNFSVSVNDQMYLIKRNTIINRTKVSKFHIPIAETFLLYTKS